MTPNQKKLLICGVSYCNNIIWPMHLCIKGTHGILILVIFPPTKERGWQKLSFFKIGNVRPIGSVRFSSVAQSCPILCSSMNRSTPGLPAHHQLPEITQTHVHRVSDAILPSHPLSSPSPPAPSPSQHQSLFL